MGGKYNYEKFKDYQKSYQKELYSFRKSLGICTACGIKSAKQGRCLCDKCLVDARERAKRCYRRKKERALAQ